MYNDRKSRNAKLYAWQDKPQTPERWGLATILIIIIALNVCIIAYMGWLGY
jgi:hypothetical protein